MNWLSDKGHPSPFVVVAVAMLVVAGIGLGACSSVTKKGPAEKRPTEGSVQQMRDIVPSGEPDSASFLAGNPSADFGDGDLTVWYRESADKVLLTFRSRQTVILNVDTNQNGQADRGADISYATLDDGKICVQFLKSPEGSADCGDYPTTASVAVRRAGTERYIAWRIPKRELAPLRKDPQVSFQVFAPEDQKSRFYPGQPFSLHCRLSPDAHSSDTGPVLIPNPKPAVRSNPMIPSTTPSQPRIETKGLPASAPPAQLPPKARPTLAPTPDPGPPRYNLMVYADSPIETGTQIKFADPRLRNLGFAVQYSGPQPPPNYGVRVEWWFEGVRYSPFNFPPGDTSFVAPHQYNNVIHDAGKFQVRLLIGGELRQTFAFEVIK